MDLLPLSVEWQGHVLTLDPLLLLPGVGGALLALGLSVASFARALAWRGDKLRAHFGVLASLLLGLWFAAGFALWPAPEASAWARLPVAGAVTALSGGVGLTALLLAMTELAQRRYAGLDWPEPEGLALLGAQALAGLLACVGGFWAGGELRGVEALPGLTLKGCELVHVDTPCTPELQVMELGVTVTTGFFRRTSHAVWFGGDAEGSVASSFDDLRGWRIPEVEVLAQASGEHAVTLEAQHRWLHISTQASVTAATAAPNPLFAPAEGRSWRLRHTREGGGVRLLFVIHEPGEEVEEEPVVLRFTDARVERGLRRWTLQVGDQSHDLVALDGETWVMEGDRPSAPALSLGEETSTTSEALKGVRLQSCALAVLPGWRCSCNLDPIDEARPLAGPALCTQSSGGGGLASLIVGLATLGTVLIDGSSESLVIEASEIGLAP